MTTQAPNNELPTDAVPDDVAPDIAGKREILDIIRPLGVDRARFVLHRVNEQKERSRKRDLREKQDRADKKQSAIPRGNDGFFRDAVKNFQFWYGPLGGHFGKPIIAALYLNAHRDRFSTWLEDRNIDPSPCLIWADEKVNLLKVMQSINGFNADATKTDREKPGLSKSSYPRPDRERLDAHPAHHSGYGEDGCKMLAGLFLLENQDHYIPWLDEKGFNTYRPMVWAERQANDFRQMIGPDAKLPACQYPEMG
ncbi:MAG: hypothetical protein L3K25_07875 [Gammaproteobacteria bacterium]|nr:hypothetical protein [Gammaproteobacteria bacterium]